MSYFNRVSSFNAGVRYLYDIMRARQLLLDLHRRQATGVWFQDLYLFQGAKAGYERCQQLLEAQNIVELSCVFKEFGIKVKPRKRRTKQQHRELA